MPAARLVVISNRKSSRNTASLSHIDELVEAYKGDVLHRAINDISEIPEVLSAFVKFDPDVMVINGGDGTIQAVLTQSSRSKPFGELPPIFVLPGGKTNLVAEDLGAFGKPEATFAQMIPALEDGSWRERLTARPLVRLRLTPDADPIYGAFFGTATVVRGLEFVRRRIHPMNLPNWLTHFLAIVCLTFSGIFNSKGENSPMRAEYSAVEIDDDLKDDGRYSLIIATTLNRLLLGLRPFPATHSQTGLKVTTVRYSVVALFKGFFAIFTRRIDREVPEGMLAREARRMTLRLDCPVTLDGEFFWPQPGEPVEIAVTRDVTFMHCRAE